jgi:hypothetical protein
MVLISLIEEVWCSDSFLKLWRAFAAVNENICIDIVSSIHAYHSEMLYSSVHERSAHFVTHEKEPDGHKADAITQFI